MPRLFESLRANGFSARNRVRWRLVALLPGGFIDIVRIWLAAIQAESRFNCQPYRNFVVDHRVNEGQWLMFGQSIADAAAESAFDIRRRITEWCRRGNLVRDPQKPLQTAGVTLDRTFGVAMLKVTTDRLIAEALDSKKLNIADAGEIYYPHTHAAQNARDLFRGLPLKRFVQWSTFDEDTKADPFAFAGSNPSAREVAGRLGLGPNAVNTPNSRIVLFRYSIPDSIRPHIPSVLEGYGDEPQEWNLNFRIAADRSAKWGITHPDPPWVFASGRPEVVHLGVLGEHLTEGLMELC
ncbi:hypothetical protein PHYC_02329 [Phycisphaerales bacterium]|nr:hypothetical protein PHYC_02329 [Phycisphaerales bacterium]